MRKISKRIITFVIAASMAVSAAPASVFADEVLAVETDVLNESEEEVLNEGETETSDEAMQDADSVETNENEEADEIQTEEVTVSEDLSQEAAVTENTDVQEDTQNAAEPSVNEISVQAEEANEEEPLAREIKAEDVYLEIDNNSGWFLVTLNAASSEQAIEKARVAVWSNANGQDDLNWYDMSKREDGSYILNTNLVKHSFDLGLYYFDVYVTDENGQDKCVASKTAEFKISMPSVKIEKKSSEYTVSVDNTIVPGGLQKIKCAVWSDVNWQDDLKWYEAAYDPESASSSLTYKSADFSSLGKYYVDVYGVNPVGRSIYLGGVTYNVEEGKIEAKSVDVEIDNASGWFLIMVNGVSADYGLDKIEVAVWSDNNDQDDLTWYTAKEKTAGNYTVNTNLVNHKFDTGLYYFDAYAVGAGNSRTYLGTAAAEFTASAGDVEIEKTQTGYKASISDVVVPGGLQKVRYAVWSQTNGQDDLRWYDGKYDSSSHTSSLTYKASDFNSVGLYYVDIYGINAIGRSVYLGGATYTVDFAKAGSVEVETDNASGWFLVTTSDISSDFGIASVRVAVWSEEEGQDDLTWYPAEEKTAGSYTVNTNLEKHKFDTGKYYFHVYATDKEGNDGCIGTATCEFTMKKGVVSVEESSGNYKVSIKDAVVPGGLQYVTFAVWSEENGQDDLHWYTGSFDIKTGSSSVTYSRNDFKSYGKYFVNIYGANGAGEQVQIGETTYTVEAPVEYDDYAASVMRNIIYAVETGGQIYGNARYNDFTEAFTNSKTERAITIGAGCWYATEARRLLTLIRQEDPELFASLDTAEIGKDIDSADWTIYGSDGVVLSADQTKEDGYSHRTITDGSSKAVAIQNIISTDVGIAVQNMLVEEQMAVYVEEAEELGVTDLKARMFCANLRHLGGYGGMRRVINNCKNEGLELTMDNLWAVMLKYDTGNQVGAPLYRTRHQKVMEWLNEYIG